MRLPAGAHLPSSAGDSIARGPGHVPLLATASEIQGRGGVPSVFAKIQNRIADQVRPREGHRRMAGGFTRRASRPTRLDGGDQFPIITGGPSGRGGVPFRWARVTPGNPGNDPIKRRAARGRLPSHAGFARMDRATRARGSRRPVLSTSHAALRSVATHVKPAGQAA